MTSDVEPMPALPVTAVYLGHGGQFRRERLLTLIHHYIDARTRVEGL